MMIEAWHADSLAGPMNEMKKAFEARNPNIMVNLTSGRSKELAERILKGEACDVFAPSDPAVVQGMFGRKVGGTDAASWYVVFSANELVVITRKGNPLGLTQMTDMAKDGITLARVTGEKDMATNRTIEFIKRATAAEGKPDFAQEIIDGAVKENTIPDVLKAVSSGKADAGIVYLSAAVTVADDTEIISFPVKVNLSEQYPQCGDYSWHRPACDNSASLRPVYVVRGRAADFEEDRPAADRSARQRRHCSL